MKGNFIVKKFPVIIKPDKWLSQVRQAENDFVKAQVDGINYGIKCKDNDKNKTRDQQ